MGIATAAEGAIDTLLTGFVSSKSAALCSALVPVATTALTIYLIMLGFAIIRGEATDPVHTILWNFLKIAFVTGLALSAGEYQSSVVNGINGITGAFLTAFSGSTTLGGMLDSAAQPYIDLGNQLWQRGMTPTFPDLSLLAAAAIVAVAQAVLFIIGLGMYLLAKVALALGLAIGPAAILCAMFPATQRFTEAWLGTVLTYVMSMVLVGVIVSMLTDLASQFAQQVEANSMSSQLLTDVVALLVLSVCMAVIMLNVPSIAAQLAGGASISGVGRDVGRGLMKFLNSEKKDPKPSGGGSVEKASGGGGGGQITPLYRRQG